MTKKRGEKSQYYVLAHRYVAVAIYNGDLPRLDGGIKCSDCESPAKEYDHRDYKKPLEVEPVCMACNAARGPGINRGTERKGPTLANRFNRTRYKSN
jgi:hypothetical protein